jgi:hypothetical protein
MYIGLWSYTGWNQKGRREGLRAMVGQFEDGHVAFEGMQDRAVLDDSASKQRR